MQPRAGGRYFWGAAHIGPRPGRPKRAAPMAAIVASHQRPSTSSPATGSPRTPPQQRKLGVAAHLRLRPAHAPARTRFSPSASRPLALSSRRARADPWADCPALVACLASPPRPSLSHAVREAVPDQNRPVSAARPVKGAFAGYRVTRGPTQPFCAASVNLLAASSSTQTQRAVAAAAHRRPNVATPLEWRPGEGPPQGRLEARPARKRPTATGLVVRRGTPGLGQPNCGSARVAQATMFLRREPC